MKTRNMMNQAKWAPGVLLTVAMTFLLAGANTARAADVDITLTGAPSTAQQGETKNFTINVSASGNLNINEHDNPGTVKVDTAYAAAVGSGSTSGTLDDTSSFSAPTTVAGGCYTQQPANTSCKNAQPVSGGPYAIAASVAVPSDLPVGFYTITIAASATKGLGLPTLMPSFELEVTAVSEAPTVTINSPANGSCHVLGAAVTASVDVGSDSAYNFSATLNDDLVSLNDDDSDNEWIGDLKLLDLGSNTFAATATNAGGSTTETSDFDVNYAFGGWLPPITTARFQNGRTLPIKFRVNNTDGPIDTATPVVKIDGVAVSTAPHVEYDAIGPFYQLEVKLTKSGPTVVSVDLGDSGGCKGETRSITINVR
ncbi:hypothetical protein [Methylobacter svalbardensis]|uniref:hypothetical protein n=1 Tax=Methylobacter svalbardensis TaxID=3080016 RepID=UPI0030ECEF6D